MEDKVSGVVLFKVLNSVDSLDIALVDDDNTVTDGTDFGEDV